MSIILFSRPVHSGKTTELLQWCRLRENVAGILMPDIDGSRKILDLSSNDIFDIQCIDPASATEPLTRVGRFDFYTQAFERANEILLRALDQPAEWLVIDEAGRLELEGKGFYPAIKHAAEVYTGNKKQGNLLITVRESLCEEVIRSFHLVDHKVVHQTKDIPL